jgi:hypothetical protein
MSLERRPPDIEGPGFIHPLQHAQGKDLSNPNPTRAWNLFNRMRVPTTKDHLAAVALWLVNAPHVHPFWQWWCISMVHLRSIDGVKEPHKQFEDAAYEFVIFAINPEACPEPDPESNDGYPWLVPFDVVHQLREGITDEQAAEMTEWAVRAICVGHMSPDQDYRQVWDEVLTTTWKHFIEEVH